MQRFKIEEICPKIYSGGTPSTKNLQYWNGILKWCAGRLWKKYDIRPSEDMTDGTPNWGYGDHLIYDAKKELAPYIKSTIKIF